jgi:hypothetical protein
VRACASLDEYLMRRACEAFDRFRCRRDTRFSFPHFGGYANAHYLTPLFL